MKVSVIIPAYNAEKTLAETLDCLLAQTLGDWEAVLVNDGSSDATEQIIAQYCAKYPRIRALSQENAGVSAARNKGLQNACGDYVLFLDSDDLLTPNSLEHLCERLDSSGADLAICRLESFGYGGQKENPHANALAQMDEIPTFHGQLLWNFLVGNKCYRRDTLLQSGIVFPPLRYSEEGVFFMRFVFSGARIVGEARGCMRYRRHFPQDGFSVSQSVNLPLLRDFLQSLQLVYQTAQTALQASGLPQETQTDYLQDVLYKTDYILISQFYRLLWRTDAETLQEIGREHDKLLAQMTPATLEKIYALNSDLPRQLLFDKQKLAQNPLMNIFLQKSSPQTIADIYAQSMPQFALFVPESLALQWKGTPLAEMENVTVLPDKQFRRNAHRNARKGLLNLWLHGEPTLDDRLFRLMLRLPIPHALRRRLGKPLYWAACFVLRRR